MSKMCFFFLRAQAEQRSPVILFIIPLNLVYSSSPSSHVRKHFHVQNKHLHLRFHFSGQSSILTILRG